MAFGHAFWRAFGVATVAGGILFLPGGVATAAPSGGTGQGGNQAQGCSLGPEGTVKHVIYMQFDNTHFLRDNPNVPSDIEQIPALLHFMERYGTVLDNDHTPLIAHTANDLITSETGLYPDNTGIAEANSYLYYEPPGSTVPGVGDGLDEAGSFSYWTDPVDSYTTANGLGTDSNYNILDAQSQNTPAPWAPFTRAGCNVGEVALADLDLENPLPDVPVVFGQNTPEAAEAVNNYDLAVTDFQGLSVHCARGADFCADNRHAVPDALPDEPGGYSGYQAVFGTKYLDSELSPPGQQPGEPPGEPTNLDGQVITDSSGNVGFPGYDSMQPTNALAYTLDMQEHGVPVTYTYLTDTHDNASTGNGMGPGEPAYEAQLNAYNQSFEQFFARLQADGITPANTLFVFGEDENDHYVGSAPTPSNCNGVLVTCSYSQVGEVDANLQGLLTGEQGVTTPFKVHSDSAPFIYLEGQPGANDPTVRSFERALAKVTAPDPYTGQTVTLANYLADPTELNVLHMVTADPARTPTLAMFANPDFYLYTSGGPCVAEDPGPNNSCESYDSEVWNHGDISPDINRSWMAFVGPGVRNLGVDGTWASETDTRPTIMALLGLKDDYTHEGAVLSELLGPGMFPAPLTSPQYAELASTYTALESPVGPFGSDTLTLSTRALASDSPGDFIYRHTDALIAGLGAQRDALGNTMITLLEGAAFSGTRISPFEADSLTAQGDALLREAGQLATGF